MASINTKHTKSELSSDNDSSMGSGENSPMNQISREVFLKGLSSELEKEASGFANYDLSEDYNQRADLVQESIAVNRPYKFALVKDLVIPRSEQPIIACFQSREDGIRQISKFVDQRDERTWIYIPEIQLWIDDTTFSEEGNVKGDFLLRTHLMNKFAEVEFFHTHPTPLYLEEIEENNLDSKYLRLAAIPTMQDIFAITYVKDCCENAGKVTGHVVSMHGVTSYCRSDFELPDGFSFSIPDWNVFEEVIYKNPETVEGIKECINFYNQSYLIEVPGQAESIQLWEFKHCNSAS